MLFLLFTFIIKENDVDDDNNMAPLPELTIILKALNKLIKQNKV